MFAFVEGRRKRRSARRRIARDLSTNLFVPGFMRVCVSFLPSSSSRFSLHHQLQAGGAGTDSAEPATGRRRRTQQFRQVSGVLRFLYRLASRTKRGPRTSYSPPYSPRACCSRRSFALHYRPWLAAGASSNRRTRRRPRPGINRRRMPRPDQAMGEALGESRSVPTSARRSEARDGRGRSATAPPDGRKNLITVRGSGGGSIDRAALAGKLDKITADMEGRATTTAPRS